MKKIFYVIAISLFSLNLTAQEEINQIDTQGRRQGRWEKVNRNGTKIYEGQFKDGYEINDFIYYYPNGNKKTVLTYSNKGIDAKSQSFYEEGKLMSEGNYKNKKKDGVWFLYSTIGTKIAHESYTQGLKNGEWITYDNDNNIIEKVMWENDKKEGIWYRKNIEGYLYGTYKDDKLSGPYEEFTDNKKTKVKGTYEKGERTGVWNSFDAQGNIIKVDNWKEDAVVSSKILLKTTDKSFLYSVDSIAYFYSKARGTEIVTPSGTKMLIQNSVDELIENITNGSGFFILVNLEKKFYAKYSSIKKVEEDSSNKKIIVILNPITNFTVYADEEGAKGLRSVFLNAQ